VPDNENNWTDGKSYKWRVWWYIERFAIRHGQKNKLKLPVTTNRIDNGLRSTTATSTADDRTPKTQSEFNYTEYSQHYWHYKHGRTLHKIHTPLIAYNYNKHKQELLCRWDSERQLFYDDIAHVLQNTKKKRTSFNKLDDSWSSTAHYVLNLWICYRISSLQL